MSEQVDAVLSALREAQDRAADAVVALAGVELTSDQAWHVLCAAGDVNRKVADLLAVVHAHTRPVVVEDEPVDTTPEEYQAEEYQAEEYQAACAVLGALVHQLARQGSPLYLPGVEAQRALSDVRRAHGQWFDRERERWADERPTSRPRLCAHAGEGDTRAPHWLAPGEVCDR
jgi:hypothetical protein